MTGDNASTTATTKTAGADGPAAGGGQAAGAGTAAGTGAEDVEELLVEEISIDGMCGVY
jgi:mycofactocin precursor